LYAFAAGFVNEYCNICGLNYGGSNVKMAGDQGQSVRGGFLILIVNGVDLL